MKVYVLESLGNDASISLHETLHGAKSRAEGKVNMQFYEWKPIDESSDWALVAKDRHETAFVIEYLQVEP